MPSTRSSARTRELLLKAAHDEFTDHGLSGGRVDRIAAAAGCNKQRIYAYFGSKEHLFEEVLRSAHRTLAESVPVPTDRDELDSYVGRVFDYHRRDPSLVRLIAWEGLNYRDAPIPGSEARRAFYLEKTTALQQALGIGDRTVVAALMLGLIGIASWPFVAPQTRRLLYEEAAPGESTMDHLRDVLTSCGRASIAAVERTGLPAL